MAKTTYTISQAAKAMGVESHVLRFWEEELELDIPRNAKGYRVYTEETMETLRQIKELKKEHALKEIRDLLKEVKAEADGEAYGETAGGILPKIQEQIKTEEELKKEIKKEIKEVIDENIAKEICKTSRGKQEMFLQIMEKLVQEAIREKKSPEGRYKELDYSIRTHQRARKEVAASRDVQSGKKKKL